MRRIRMVLVVLVGLLVSQTITWSAKPKPKFPESVMICRAKATDTFARVWKLYGRNYKKTHEEGEIEFPCVIYNDPKFEAHLVIASVGPPVSANESVGHVTLRRGRIPGKYFASQSFDGVGNYYGLNLSSTKRDIEKHYGPLRLQKTEKDTYYGSIDLTADQLHPCGISFTFKKGKLVEISAGIWS